MNILAISDWSASENYKKNDIVKTGPINGFYSYWYSTLDNAVLGGGVPGLSNPNWGGRAAAANGSPNKFSSDGAFPRFFWMPNYGINKKTSPKIKQIQFGNGYAQTLKDGINNVLLEIEMIFDGRDLLETGAILHFLTAREGNETFLYTPSSPYAIEKRWKCFSWSDTQVFYNNFQIRATFTEVIV